MVLWAVHLGLHKPGLNVVVAIVVLGFVVVVGGFLPQIFLQVFTAEQLVVAESKYGR